MATSSFPQWRALSATARSRSPSRVTSQATARGFALCAAAIFCTKASSSSARRDASVSFAPAWLNCQASSSPMPEEAPVMSTTLSRKNLSVLDMRSEKFAWRLGPALQNAPFEAPFEAQGEQGKQGGTRAPQHARIPLSREYWRSRGARREHRRYRKLMYQ